MGDIEKQLVIKKWLESIFKTDKYEMYYLQNEASFRRYLRVHLNGQSFIIMDAPPEKINSTPFINIDHFLEKNNIRVPHIINYDIEQGLLLLEDFGDETLLHLLNQQTVDDLYLQSFKIIIQLQSIPISLPLNSYSYINLMWEMTLFTDWLLPSLSIHPTQQQLEIINKTLDLVVNVAILQPKVLIHRDFHSRNIMKVAGTSDCLGILDFQDCVMGPYTYDLISITRDAYIDWSGEQVYKFFKVFYDLLPEITRVDKSFDAFKRDADFMSIQRHLKILGLFIRLAERDGKLSYLHYLPRVLNYLQEECKPYKELDDFMKFINDHIISKFFEKYGPMLHLN